MICIFLKNIFRLFIPNLFTKLFLWIQRQRSTSWYIQSSIVITVYTIISMTRKQSLMKYTSTIGEPTLQIITKWVTTKGTTLDQRGATRDKSTRTEV